MDDRRFDSLVKSLATGQNRRSVLKGLLGLGGVALAGSAALGDDAKAARRPAIRTPTPVRCPGIQYESGGTCVCPATAPSKCGPDCCTGTSADPPGPDHSECCDNACCFGHCYGEELCCPYPREFCPITGECCPDGWTCCPDFGCISPDQCCTAEDCPFRECFAAICGPSHTCVYGDDCLSGVDCCEAPVCFRSDCQEDGSCAEPVFDCTTGTGCCTGEGAVCREDGSCCTPNCPAGSCGDDGCGGLCGDGACPEGQFCSGGGCFHPCVYDGQQYTCPMCSLWNCRVFAADGTSFCVNPNTPECTGDGCAPGYYCTHGFCFTQCS